MSSTELVLCMLAKASTKDIPEARTAKQMVMALNAKEALNAGKDDA